jgi:hypothetical protein
MDSSFELQYDNVLLDVDFVAMLLDSMFSSFSVLSCTQRGNDPFDVLAKFGNIFYKSKNI